MAAMFVSLPPEVSSTSGGGSADKDMATPSSATETPSNNSKLPAATAVHDHSASGMAENASQNDLIVVYENEFDEEDDFIFLESCVLSNIAKVCKVFVIAVPLITVILILVCRQFADNSDNELSQKVFEGALVLGCGVTFALMYYFCKYGICRGRRYLERVLGDAEEGRARSERQRAREELRLQAKDPWRRKLFPESAASRKPYFNHVELYRETGLYKDAASRY